MTARVLDDESVIESEEEAGAVQPAAWRTNQAAARLNIPYRTLMDLIHDGRLEVVRAGRYYLVPEQSIQTFLAGAQAAS